MVRLPLKIILFFIFLFFLAPHFGEKRISQIYLDEDIQKYVKSLSCSPKNREVSINCVLLFKNHNNSITNITIVQVNYFGEILKENNIELNCSLIRCDSVNFTIKLKNDTRQIRFKLN